MADAEIPLTCPYCESADVEIVLAHARRKGCFCTNCSKTFSVEIPLTERQADRERRIAE